MLGVPFKVRGRAARVDTESFVSLGFFLPQLGVPFLRGVATGEQVWN